MSSIEANECGLSVGAPFGADPRDAAAYEVQEGLVILIVVEHVPRRGE